MNSIDLNCDLGEGFPNDAAIMPYISSCNIACGGHFGSKETITQTINLAKDNNVKIGAHPSYPDTINFGRKTIIIDKESFIKTIKEQITLFFTCAAVANTNVNHIKAHGALYNDLVHDEERVNWYLKAVNEYKNNIKLYVPFNSLIAKRALENGFNIAYEAFADRNYTNALTLVPRSFPNAIIKKNDEVLRHILALCVEKKVTTIEGKQITIKADTICVHGDNENAIEIAKLINNILKENNITVE